MIPLNFVDKACKACGTQNPANVSKPSVADSLMDKFKPAPGSWSCKECFIKNTAEAKACVACGSSREPTDKLQKSSDAFGSAASNFSNTSNPSNVSGLFRFGAPNSGSATTTANQPSLPFLQSKPTPTTTATNIFGTTSSTTVEIR